MTTNTHATMATPCRIFYLSPKQTTLFIQKQNKDGHYVESVKRYLDARSLKTTTGIAKLAGIADVWVDDDPTTRAFPHHLLTYNEDYQRMWGNSPLYGNVFVCLTKKGWEALPEEKRIKDDLSVLRLTLQPAHPDQKYCERCGMPNGTAPPTNICDVCEEEDV